MSDKDDAKKKVILMVLRARGINLHSSVARMNPNQLLSFAEKLVENKIDPTWDNIEDAAANLLRDFPNARWDEAAHRGWVDEMIGFPERRNIGDELFNKMDRPGERGKYAAGGALPRRITHPDEAPKPKLTVEQRLEEANRKIAFDRQIAAFKKKKSESGDE